MLELQEKLDADWPVIWKPMLLIEVPPELLILSVSGEPAWPTGRVEKESSVGVTLITAGCSPVPARATVCVRITSETVRLPLMAPAVEGANTTAITQLAWPVSEVPQVFDS